MPDTSDAFPRGDELATLATLLDAASHIVDELSGELIGRVVDVLGKFPPEDRDFILNVLEREARSRTLAEATGSTTGLSLRPNPNARLYVRVVDPGPVTVEHEKIVTASVRSMRMVHAVITPIRDRWLAAMRTGIEMLDADERAGVVQFTKDILALVEEADQADAALGAARVRRRQA
jgi:hypothetical protein